MGLLQLVDDVEHVLADVRGALDANRQCGEGGG